MARGDRTGPNGQGSMTGRGRGFCAGFNAPGFANNGVGRGRGSGRGMGFRAQNFVQPVQQVELTKEQKKKILDAELAEIEAEKSEIEKQIKELN